MYKHIKMLTLLIGLLVFSVSVQAAVQCTTSELDLMCAEGQVLQGIEPDGTKICVSPTAGIFGGMYAEHLDGNCRHGNPLNSGRCGCPEGFSAEKIYSFEGANPCTKYYTDASHRGGSMTVVALESFNV